MGLLEKLFGLSGKTGLVTGAGSGLGRVIAEGFAEVGAHVICADIEQSRVDEVVKSIGAAGGKASALQLDVADEASVDAGFNALPQKHLDILVNFAGVASAPARTHELSIEEWHRLISINLTGTFLTTRAALPRMLERGGSIINVSSVIGMGGYYPDFPSTGLHYAASKAGVVGLTRQLAAEYAAPKNSCQRDRAGMALRNAAWRFPPSTIDGAGAATLHVRDHAKDSHEADGEPSEILGLALYLAAPASAYLTGQLIAQDGGWTAC